VKAGDLLRRLHDAQRRLPVRALDLKAILRRAHRIFAVSLGTVVVGVVAVSGATAVGVNQVVAPDPIDITGGWRVVGFEETENVRVVPIDFAGAEFRIVELPCDDEPCASVLRGVEGSEDALILQGMRFEPDEGGSVYLGTRRLDSDCVVLETGALIAERVYDTTITVRWEALDEGGDTGLRFVYTEEGTIRSRTEDCPKDIRREASFRAERISKPSGT
jgi:hypothetical protein